jgi:dienelactone hydrolase
MKMRYRTVIGVSLFAFFSFAPAFGALALKQNGAVVMQIGENGDCSFVNGYSEQSSNGALSGDIRIAYSDAVKDWSRTESGGKRVNFSGRFSVNAIVPPNGLLVRNASSHLVASLAGNGDFFTQGVITEALTDPSTPGTYSCTSAVYASTGAQLIPQYQTPTPGYEISRRCNLTLFSDFIDENAWGFGANSVPLNGMLRIPSGPGPFPLVLFVHGAHGAFDYSEPGYIYLCDLLASQGIIAATIDENFLNSFGGGNDVRAIVMLEHVKQFGIWNAQSGHPLFGKVDMSKIMLVGHSRGGEAVALASYINTLDAVQPYPGASFVPLNDPQGFGPYHFSLQTIFAFGPVDGQYIPVGGMAPVKTNYFVMQGGKAGDVGYFDGYATYSRAHPIDLVNPTNPAGGFKALLYIYGANHNYFNTVWGSDRPSAPTITAEEQQQIAKVYVAAVAKVTLQGDSRYIDILRSYSNAAAWLPPVSETMYVSQYQDKQRAFYNHFEEDRNPVTVSPPAVGTNTPSNLPIDAEVQYPYRTESDLSIPVNYMLSLGWNSLYGKYQTTFQPPLQNGNYPYLALHVGVTEDPLNPTDQNQNFTVCVKDNVGNSASVAASSYAVVPYPNKTVFDTYEMIPQTVRIPLRAFADQGIDPAKITEISVLTDRTASGSLYIDEMQLTY